MNGKPESRLFFSQKSRNKLRVKAISISFAVGLVLTGVKFNAWFLTGSSAILSDALESIINIVAAAFALGSVIWATKPPDESHPYGHGKIENFSAGFEGALIIIAACGIFWTGTRRIFRPQPLTSMDAGLLLLLGAGLVNLFLGLYLVRTGKKTDSLTLYADGKHVLTDVYTSAGVLGGLVLVRHTGWYGLDGIIAAIVGCHILISGFKLVRRSFAGLMDESDPDLLKRISTLLTIHRKDEWIDIHHLRAWRSGNLIHIDFHLILPRDMSLKNAHGEADELENLISKDFNGMASVLIHMAPCIDDECPICARDSCGLRKKPLHKTNDWNRKALTGNSRTKIQEAG